MKGNQMKKCEATNESLVEVLFQWRLARMPGRKVAFLHHFYGCTWIYSRKGISGPELLSDNDSDSASTVAIASAVKITGCYNKWSNKASLGTNVDLIEQPLFQIKFVNL